MRRPLASFFTLLVLASAPQVARVDVGALIPPAEVECLLRQPQPGVRWQWDGTWCVGLIVESAGAPAE